MRRVTLARMGRFSIAINININTSTQTTTQSMPIWNKARSVCDTMRCIYYLLQTLSTATSHSLILIAMTQRLRGLQTNAALRAHCVHGFCDTSCHRSRVAECYHSNYSNGHPVPHTTNANGVANTLFLSLCPKDHTKTWLCLCLMFFVRLEGHHTQNLTNTRAFDGKKLSDAAR